MDTLKNVAVGIGFGVLLAAMLIGSAMDIGRVDPFDDGPERSREFCGDTPPSMMNEEELQRCAWIREEDERPYVPQDFFGGVIDIPADSDGP